MKCMGNSTKSCPLLGVLRCLLAFHQLTHPNATKAMLLRWLSIRPLSIRTTSPRTQFHNCLKTRWSARKYQTQTLAFFEDDEEPRGNCEKDGRRYITGTVLEIATASTDVQRLVSSTRDSSIASVIRNYTVLFFCNY